MAATDKALRARLRRLHELPRNEANRAEMARLRRLLDARSGVRARRGLGLPESTR